MRYERFENYLRAGFPLIWVSTLEPHRAEKELAAIAKKVHITTPQRWDVVSGFGPVGETTTQTMPPVKAISTAAGMGTTVTFLWNFHRFMNSTEVIQAIENAIPALKSAASCLVILAPDADKLVPELARFTVVWDFDLPSAKDLQDTAKNITSDAGMEPGNEDPALIDAALGLTISEAEDAFALSLVETQKLDPAIVAREKAGALLRQSKIEMSTFTERFDGLGGLDVIKEYTCQAAQSPMSLGILLLGPPGTGKSHFAKALGNELHIPTLSLDFGKMMGSLVGQSEGNMRSALQAVDAIGHCVLYIDEIEKGLAGVQSSGNLDSGTKAGVGSSFLKWASDRKPGVAYIVATCNDITQLPPEYTRSGRFDAIFWLDLPNAEERDVIWKIYEQKFQLTGLRPDDKDWTGAEICSCCRTAVMLGCDLRKAGEYIIPMAKTMSEKIEALRDWAKGRAIPASKAASIAAGRKLALTR
jgi:hypothetical protein